MANPTWYDILGVAPDATPDQIKAAWRTATDKFEPGSGTGQFRMFNDAADVLLDPERRAAYDAELAGDAPAAEAVPEVEPEAEPTPDDEPAVDAGPSSGTVAQGPLPPPSTRSTPVRTWFASTRGGPLAILGRLNDYVVAALAVLVVGSLVLAVYLALQIQDRVEVADAGPDASATAERALKAVLSYDYRHMEADRDRAAQFLAPKYRKDYLKTFNELLEQGPDGTPGPAVKTKAVVTADVLDTGVVDSESDQVRVVAFVNQSSVKGTAQPTIFQNRVVATMVRDGDTWLIENIKSY